MRSVYVLIPLTLIMSGCSKSPDCGSSETSQIIHDIALKNFYSVNSFEGINTCQVSKWEVGGPGAKEEFVNCMDKSEKLFEKNKEKIVTNLIDSITTSRNRDTGAVECKATLHAELDNFGSSDRYIKYSVEKTTDGNLYVAINQ